MIAKAVRNVVVAALLILCPSLPVLAQGVGTIGGTIADESGAVLPGVTVTLSSPGTIGGNQNTVSDGRGAYQFTRLVPGSYSVKAELAGFRTVIQENIEVNADRTSRADLKLVVGELSEQMTITAEAPLLDTTTALNQTVMTRDVLDSLPTGNDIWSIARLAPAVHLSTYDVGGRNMIQQTSSFVHGSTTQDQAFLIDGVDATSYSDGSSTNFFFDSFSAQEMNYQTGQVPAEQSKGGVLINVITKTGTNAFHGAGMFSGTNHSLESNNVSPALRTQLLASVPAVALAANPNISAGGEIQRLYDTAASASGPIVRDRLWFAGTVKLGEANSYAVGSYNADGTQLLSDNKLVNTLIKLSWAANSSNQLHFTHAWVAKNRYHQGGLGTFASAQATQYNPSRNTIIMPRLTSVLSSQMVFDVAADSMNGQTNNLPQPDVPPGALPRLDTVTLRGSGAVGSYTINEGRRTNVVSSLSYVAGNHDVKVGYQYMHTSNPRGAVSTFLAPSGLIANYANGVPISVNTYNNPTRSVRLTNAHSLFAQDKWRPVAKLTLNIGVRFETTNGQLEGPLCQVANVFIVGQCFADVKNAPDFKQADPRVSAIYDLFGDGKTALKFSANRYRTPQDPFPERINPIAVASDTRPWTACATGQVSGCDLNNDLIPQLNELGPSTGFNLGTTNRYATDISWPYVNQISGEIEQQLPGDVVVSAGYYYMAHKNQIGATNLAVPTSGYIPMQVTEVNSGRQVTVYNQDANTRGRFDTLLSNLPEVDDHFHGADVAVQKRMSNRWMLMGSLSFGTSEGDIYGTTSGGTTGFADRNNPNLVFRRGPDSRDVPVFLKLSGTYELPYGLSIGANEQRYSGWPQTTTVLVNSATARLTQVSQSVVVEPRGTKRFPSINIVDFNVRKSITSGNLKIQPRMDVFNVFNAAAITAQVTQLGPTYGRATGLLGARLIRLGVNIDF